jgi:hypothetical protein
MKYATKSDFGTAGKDGEVKNIRDRFYTVIEGG